MLRREDAANRQLMGYQVAADANRHGDEPDLDTIANNVKVNEGLRDSLSVKGNTISGTLKVGADDITLRHLKTFVKDANRVLYNKSLVDASGVEYTSKIKLKSTRGGDRDIMLRVGIGPGKHLVYVFTGYSNVFIRKGATLPSISTAAHEIGHVLGLHHQSNETYSLMSYSALRKLTASDIKRLVEAYR